MINRLSVRLLTPILLLILSSHASSAHDEALEMVSGMMLKRISSAAPMMPNEAIKKKISGSVEVEFTVNEEGYVEDAQVLISIPENVFDNAALEAIRKWRYEPPKHNGRPTRLRTKVRLSFDSNTNGRSR
jgi:TonB family protein